MNVWTQIRAKSSSLPHLEPVLSRPLAEPRGCGCCFLTSCAFPASLATRPLGLVWGMEEGKEVQGKRLPCWWLCSLWAQCHNPSFLSLVFLRAYWRLLCRAFLTTVMFFVPLSAALHSVPGYLWSMWSTLYRFWLLKPPPSLDNVILSGRKLYSLSIAV